MGRFDATSLGPDRVNAVQSQEDRLDEQDEPPDDLERASHMGWKMHWLIDITLWGPKRGELGKVGEYSRGCRVDTRDNPHQRKLDPERRQITQFSTIHIKGYIHTTILYQSHNTIPYDTIQYRITPPCHSTLHHITTDHTIS